MRYERYSFGVKIKKKIEYTIWFVRGKERMLETN